MTPKFPDIKIDQVSEMSDELFQACKRLIPQLTHNNPAPTQQELSLLLASSASTLFAAYHKDFGIEIVGLATVVIYRVPTGLRGYIEDVVVDERARGKRIGEALSQRCLEKAEQEGATQVMLTSNPGRSAANRLYRRMGFEQRKTNVYKYRFKAGLS
jgi:ribosomal protein S18 acetylase RimI-like enzyme